MHTAGKGEYGQWSDISNDNNEMLLHRQEYCCLKEMVIEVCKGLTKVAEQ